VLRQRCLGTHFNNQPVKPPFPREEIDIDTSYVFDPSEPIATPRLAYLPGTTLLVRLRVHLARYHHDYTHWRHTTLKHVRRGSLSIVEAGRSIKLGTTAVDVPTPTDPEQLHPESPVATARDSLDRLLVAALRRNRTVVIGEVVKDSRRPMEAIPDSGQARRPLALGLAALKEDAIVAYPTRAHRIRLHTKHWPDGTWAAHDIGAPGSLHPLGGFAASAFAKGDHVFLAAVAPWGHLLATSWTASATQILVPPKDTPFLCVTSAVAAASPSADDDLAFGITDEGELMLIWFSPKPVQKWGSVVSTGTRLFVHSRLGVAVENEGRVHVAGIDIHGEVRRWAAERISTSNRRWILRNPALIGKGSPAAPNPWTDVALTYTPTDASAAVAGVDEAVDDPERRTMAFRAAMFTQIPWSTIRND